MIIDHLDGFLKGLIMGWLFVIIYAFYELLVLYTTEFFMSDYKPKQL